MNSQRCEAVAVVGSPSKGGPEDLSVTRFENSELSAHINRPLTGVRSDSFLWGRTAAEVLLQFLQPGDSGEERTLPPAQLVISDSAAVCHGGDS